MSKSTCYWRNELDSILNFLMNPFVPFWYGCKRDAWVQVHLSLTVWQWLWSWTGSRTSCLGTVWVIVTSVSLSVVVAYATTPFFFGTMLKVVSHKRSHRSCHGVWCDVLKLFVLLICFNQMVLQCANLDGKQCPWKCTLVFIGLSICTSILYTNLPYCYWIRLKV